jgi:hypothetical protein
MLAFNHQLLAVNHQLPFSSQVFLSFGPNLSPTELLLDYGFVDSANSNDKIELEARLVGETCVISEV